MFRYEKPLMLRVPIIPGFNDDRENIEKPADFAEELNKSGKLKKVNILPYHAYGVRKYDILDMPYALRELQPPTDTEIDEIIDVFCEKGIAVQKGG